MAHPCSRLWQLRRLQDKDGSAAFDETWLVDESACYGSNPDDIQPFFSLFDVKPPATVVDGSNITATRSRSNPSRIRRGGGGGEGDIGRAGDAGRSTGFGGGVGVDDVHNVHHGVAPPKKYYTNAEIYHFLAPNGEPIPYVYDNFEWPHCDVSRAGLTSYGQAGKSCCEGHASCYCRRYPPLCLALPCLGLWLHT